MLKLSRFFLLHFFLKVLSLTNGPLFHKSEATFSKHFPLNNYFFCFLLYTLECLETCANCVTKCGTAKIYPCEVLIKQILFFKVILQTIINIFPQIWDHNIKTVVFLLTFWFCFLLQASKCFETCVNCFTNCVMLKIGWHTDLHSNMNPNLTSLLFTDKKNK